MKKNSIYPYKEFNTWFFDDVDFHIYHEPFVMGVSEMIDNILHKKGINDKQIKINFSTEKFADADVTLFKTSDLEEGAMYEISENKESGWLCPALFKYFQMAPEKIYIQVSNN